MNIFNRIQLVLFLLGIFLGGDINPVENNILQRDVSITKNYHIEMRFIPKAQDMSDEGRYYGDGILVCKNIGVCMHELGHMVDDTLGYISKTEEFQIAVDIYLEDNPCDKPHNDGTTKCMIAHWDGLYGNPFRHGYWGGYSELYASLWSAFTTENYFPPEFAPYFVVINP